MSDIRRVDLLRSPTSRNADTISVNRSVKNFSFNQGDLLTVSVERVIGSEKVLINIEGQRVTAATTAPLKDGDKIQVLVEQKTPFLLLRPVKQFSDLTAVLASSIRKAPPWDIDVGKLFFKLLAQNALKENADFLLMLKNSVLEESSLSGGGRHGAKRLEELIRNSGIFMENRLSASTPEGGISRLDVKAALLQAIDTYQNANSPEQKRALNDIKTLLSAVESFQNLNSLNRERGEGLTLTLPFFFQGEVRNLKIFLNKREKGKKGSIKKEFQVSLMLELGALKKIRADIVKKDKDVFVTLFVQEEAIKEQVQAEFENLRDKLGELGFQTHTDCFVSAEKYVDGEVPGREFISDIDKTINFTV